MPRVFHPHRLRAAPPVGTLLLVLIMGSCMIPRAWAAQPEWAAAGSLLIPGLGQAVNGDYIEGGIHFGITVVMLNQLSALEMEDDYIEFEDRIDQRNRLILINKTSFAADLYSTALTNFSFYSAFAAYRDARAEPGNQGYSTPAPAESAQDLALSPFRWRYLSRPTTFVPLIIVALGALAPRTDEQFVFQPDSSITRDELAAGFAFQHEMVAVGEESLFRGVLNNSSSHLFGEFWGLAVSSALFGVAHQGLGNQATPLGAAIFGAYSGYLHQLNDYRLGESVALHYWWNLIVSLGLLQQRDPEQTVQLLDFRLRF